MRTVISTLGISGNYRRSLHAALGARRGLPLATRCGARLPIHLADFNRHSGSGCDPHFRRTGQILYTSKVWDRAAAAIGIYLAWAWYLKGAGRVPERIARRFPGVYQVVLQGSSALPIYTSLAHTGWTATLVLGALAVLSYPVDYLRNRWLAYRTVFPWVRGALVIKNDDLHATQQAVARLVGERWVA